MDGEKGRGRRLARAKSGEGRGRWGGVGSEGAIGSRDGEGSMGKGRWAKGQRGEGEEGARRGGGVISQMDMMKCLGGHLECLGGKRLQSFLT